MFDLMKTGELALFASQDQSDHQAPKDMESIKGMATYLNKSLKMQGLPEIGEPYSVRDSEVHKTVVVIQKLLSDKVSDSKRRYALEERLAKAESNSKMYMSQLDILK